MSKRQALGRLQEGCLRHRPSTRAYDIFWSMAPPLSSFSTPLQDAACSSGQEPLLGGKKSVVFIIFGLAAGQRMSPSTQPCRKEGGAITWHKVGVWRAGGHRPRRRDPAGNRGTQPAHVFARVCVRGLHVQTKPAPLYNKHASGRTVQPASAGSCAG